MLSHVTIGATDLGRAAGFYGELMAVLGIARIADEPADGLVGYGRAPEVVAHLRPRRARASMCATPGRLMPGRRAWVDLMRQGPLTNVAAPSCIAACDASCGTYGG